MTTQPDRIISLLSKQSEHPVRNSILFAFGWFFLIFVGAILMVIIVVPRIQGYVTYTCSDDSMNKTFAGSDLLVFQKIRQTGAQNLNPGDIVAFQPDSGKEVYRVGRVESITGSAESMQFEVAFDNAPVAQGVTLDEMRGQLMYKVPIFGATFRLWPSAAKSFMLIMVSQLLLIYAGWQIGTSMINARDPQRQARAARLRTAALAGNLETTRQRLRRQGLR